MIELPDYSGDTLTVYTTGGDSLVCFDMTSFDCKQSLLIKADRAAVQKLISDLQKLIEE